MRSRRRWSRSTRRRASATRRTRFRSLRAPRRRGLGFEQLESRELLTITVNFDTVLGSFQVQLFDEAAPRTVANFLNYATSGRFNESFIHRAVPGFVVQGGGFTFDNAPHAVQTDPPVLNEFSPSRSNLRGTIAMAKLGGDPNSATSQWFFNLADNSANLDSQNGGFTVFGQVVGNGMQIVDQFAGATTGGTFSRYNLQSLYGSTFTAVPLSNYTNGQQVTAANLALIHSVTVVGNAAPILIPYTSTPLVVNEGQAITPPTTVADDYNTSQQLLTYSLVNPPQGVTINPSTGAVSWTPNLQQGNQTYALQVQVTNQLGLSDTGTFSVTVNDSPTFNALGAQSVVEGNPLSFIVEATDADTPAASLFYSLDPGAPEGVNFNPATRTFTWTPTEAQGPGTYNVTFRARDNREATGTLTVPITVTDANTAPVIAPISNKSILQGATLQFTVSANDTDQPSQTLTYTLDTAPQGAAIDPNTGLFHWDIPANQAIGPYNVVVRATDNGSPALSGTQSFTVNVKEPNIAPVLGAIGNKTTPESTLLSFTATASDANNPPDQLRYSLINAPQGAAIDAATGQFTWVPTEAQGPASFTFTVRVTDDGAPELFDEEQITVDVTEVNLPPVLQPLTQQTVGEANLVSFVVSANDPDLPAGTLTYALEPGAPQGANFNPATRTFTWTPTEAQGPGNYQATFRVTDSSGLFDTKTVAISVLEVNQLPTITPLDDRTINEGQLLSLSVAAQDTDAPAQSLVFSLDPGAPQGLAIDANSGQLTWTPTEFQGPGQYVVTVRVTDSAGGSASDSFNVTVAELNSPPVLAAQAARQIVEATLLDVTFTASDPDFPVGALVFSLGADPPVGATIDPQSGRFSWTPSEAQGPGSYAITVTVTDPTGLSDTKTFDVTVFEAPRAPAFTPILSQGVAELSELSFTVSATDADLPANTLVYSMLASAPQGATFDPATRVFRWTPTEAQGPGQYTATFRVDDGTGLSDLLSVAINVSEANQPPTLAAIPSQSVAEGTTLTFTAQGSDADSPQQPLTYSLANVPNGASIDPATGVFTWTPSEAQGPGNYSIVVRVTDPSGASAEQTVDIAVGEVNQAPQFAPIAAQTLFQGQSLNLPARAADADLPQNALTYQLNLSDEGPAGITIDPATGVVRWTPTSDQAGNYLISVTVTDSTGLSDTTTFAVAVLDIDPATLLFTNQGFGTAAVATTVSLAGATPFGAIGFTPFVQNSIASAGGGTVAPLSLKTIPPVGAPNFSFGPETGVPQIRAPRQEVQRPTDQPQPNASPDESSNEADAEERRRQNTTRRRDGDQPESDNQAAIRQAAWQAAVAAVMAEKADELRSASVRGSTPTLSSPQAQAPAFLAPDAVPPAPGVNPAKQPNDPTAAAKAPNGSQLERAAALAAAIATVGPLLVTDLEPKIKPRKLRFWRREE